MSEVKRLYGWFSQQAHQHNGSIVYKNADGREVLVTEVTYGSKPIGHWKDYQPVGEVVKFVRNATYDYDAFRDYIKDFLGEDYYEKPRRLADSRINVRMFRLGEPEVKILN